VGCCAVACHGTKPDADRRRTGSRPGEGAWHFGAAGWRADCRRTGRPPSGGEQDLGANDWFAGRRRTDSPTRDPKSSGYKLDFFVRKTNDLAIRQASLVDEAASSRMRPKEPCS
jgi:hypothetical protein